MNAKWYASTLFIILVFLGLSKEQKKASNQQISLQFVDLEFASETVHDEVLALIREKLQVLGIDAIEIVENDERQLSIRYYSEVDANTVEQFLSEENQLEVSNGGEFPFDFPKEKIPEQYHLVVSDLYLQVDGTFNLQGTLVFDQEQKDTNFAYPVALPYNATIGFNRWAYKDSTHKINSNIFIAFDKISYQIPEVRAGPYKKRNS